MKKYYWFFLLIVNFSFAQVVINEIDADQPGSDTKEFMELKSTTPFFNLDNYFLVFYNGTTGLGTLSYNTIDLSGFYTDANGIFLIGNNLVIPSPAIILPANSLQNGPDAVGLYTGNPNNYPIDTPANATNLVDAMAYSNSSVLPSALMTILNITTCLQDNQSTNSIQRKNDGTYEVNVPTPGVLNDGTGIVLNYVTMQVAQNNYNEGQSFQIFFNTSMTVTSTALNFTISLNNGSFTNSDFTGNTSLTISVGSSSTSTTITLVDDTIDEGDEVLKLRINGLVTPYSTTNNNLMIRVYDNDFQVQNYGTPLNPTYTFVSSTAPVNYYSTINGKNGLELKQALQDIIANPNVVRKHTYGDVVDILYQADKNPLNSNQVWQMYVESPKPILDYQTGNSNVGVWNREHIWPQSRGGFSGATSSFPDGINTWEPTSAADIASGHSDAHHIRAEDGVENSSRSNKDYGLNDYNGPTGNTGSWKGDVARALFYMAIRYNGLEVLNGNLADSTVGQIGDLATLLSWHTQDPPDDFEMNRNNYIYTWQMNRNPFIDRPDLANYIWGANTGQNYFLNQENFSLNNVEIYPNPTNHFVNISGIINNYNVEIATINGQVLKNLKDKSNSKIDISHLESGIYFLRISNSNGYTIKKLIKL
jgi:hypothetical protein